MTDHPDDDEMRDDREFVRRLFSTADSPPRDIVPGSGPTREDFLRWNDSADTYAEVVVPGDVICDPDGVPIGMSPAVTQTVYRGATIVTSAQLARVGLTPADVPNLSVLDPQQHEGETK